MRGAAILMAAVAGVALAMPVPALAAPRTHVVIIDKMKFGAMPRDARRGDIIVWDNRDMFRHTATSGRAFDVDLPAGQRRDMRLTATGDFKVLCKYHPGMKARLKVTK